MNTSRKRTQRKFKSRNGKFICQRHCLSSGRFFPSTFVFYGISLYSTFTLTPFSACGCAEVRSRSETMASDSCQAQGWTSKMHHQSRQIVSISSLLTQQSPFQRLRHFVNFLKSHPTLRKLYSASVCSSYSYPFFLARGQRTWSTRMRLKLSLITHF